MAARAVTIRFTGQAQLNARMIRSADGVQSAAARGVRRLTNQAFGVSQILVPVETGALKRTGRTHFLRVGKWQYRGSVLYGGASYPRFVDYAVYVHEILENKHAPPTQAKFVETAYRLAEAAAGQTIKQYVAGALTRSFTA
ncbi:MAG: hypothetical protein MUF33_00465 [Candidatus Nanopelagicales bacterium]|jgi:hypothetical protein|nr:hypothetical protein [Candidatus Nanopelagicales bacterium]